MDIQEGKYSEAISTLKIRLLEEEPTVLSTKEEKSTHNSLLVSNRLASEHLSAKGLQTMNLNC